MTKKEQQTIYVSPHMETLEIKTQAIVCTSAERLSGNEFDWGGSGSSTEPMPGSDYDW